MKLTESRLLTLTLSAALTGVLAAGSVLLFRWVIEYGQSLFLPGGRIGNYEALPVWARFALPVAGGLFIGLAFNRFPPALRQVGITHMLLQLRNEGRPSLPAKNALVQFVFGALAVITGHSVDREGPGVHLGAAAGNYVGRGQKLSSEEDYTLIACGAAASIAAAFNTPLAGAIFVIEVLRVRYHISRFMPIILAAVIGAVISRSIHGDSPSFVIPEISLESLGELPIIALLGVIIGLLATGFNTISRHIAESTLKWSPAVAFTLAGIVTGTLGIWSPAILGISYDTLDNMLHNHITISALWLLLTFKLIATAVSIGMRLPGGLIAPVLVIGGAAGSLLAGVTAGLLPLPSSPVAFYATIGMLTMMGATLQAPIAALIALLEMTGNPHIILPGMLAIVMADLVSRVLFNQESVFLALQVTQRQKIREAEPAAEPATDKETVR